MPEQLTHGSQGVVHSTPQRTRLRVPADYRDRAILRHVEEEIQKISGVKYCETNETTGSIVVYHEPVDGILEKIGSAIHHANAKLFHLMVQAPPEKVSAFSSLIGKAKKRVASAGVAAEGADINYKKVVPLAFLAAGVWQMIETESLLAGMAPLVLFYYAFDTWWKFGETSLTQNIEGQVEDR